MEMKDAGLREAMGHGRRKKEERKEG